MNAKPHKPILLGLLAILVESAFGGDFFSSKLQVQFEVSCVTEENLPQYIADVKASKADAVQVACDRIGETGEKRAKTLAWVGKVLKTFDDLGYPTAIWTSALGYGTPLPPDEAKWLEGSQRLVSLAGDTPTTANCPLDPQIQDLLTQSLRDFIRLGAKIVLYDDDWIQNSRRHVCCACPRHLALIEKRLGRKVTVAEVRNSFTGSPNAVRTAFLDANGEAMMTLARHLRGVADAIDPSVTLGVCASYPLYDFEGVDVDEFLTVLAGKGGHKLLRLSGAPYWRNRFNRHYTGEDLDGICELIRLQAGWMKGKGVTMLDENDPYPRRAEIVPPWATELYDKAMIAEGNIVRNKYILRFDSKRSEPGYFDAHMANLADDAVLREIFAGTESYGFRCIFPEHSLRTAELPEKYIGEQGLLTLSTHPLAAHFLALNGIPVKHDGKGPAIAFGAAALTLDEETMRQGVILDSVAADLLKKKRGIDPYAQTSQPYKFVVRGFDGRTMDYFAYKPGSHRASLVEAAKSFGMNDLCTVESFFVYQIFKRDPRDGSISVLVENLFDFPLHVRINTPAGTPTVLKQLRGEFKPDGNSLVRTEKLQPHRYTAVKFICK